ncbi:MAG: SulP family inorganic anion transporter [Methylocystis sp.]
MRDTVANRAPGAPSFFESFTPKLVSTLREGYTLAHLRADAMAGLTVAIVALPLSMAIAIASGAKPENGLIAAVVGGVLISALGGCRFQIGGPAGAFIVLVAKTIEMHGYQGFLAATIMSGLILIAIGYARLGVYIKYIPYSVTIGFTAGVAVIIFASQIKDLLGLRVEHEPGAFVPKLAAIQAALGTATPAAFGLAAASLAFIMILRIWNPRFPGLLAAIALAGFATWALGLPVETIGSKFGEVPRGLPAPALPQVSLGQLTELLPSAVAIALLGGIESLLSAVVADGMTGRRHRSNCELAAQGYANIGSALFGGLCCTGAIARTATNIRAGAHGPVAGILHALFLLTFMAVAAPLAAHIPLATLAAVLTIVAWNMIEREQIVAMFKNDHGEALVLAATFLLTVFEDITVGIGAGVSLGSLLFMHRMAEAVEIESGGAPAGPDEDVEDESGCYVPERPDAIMTYRINGPFFFGVAATISAVLDAIGPRPEAFILDLTSTPLADAAAANALRTFALKAARRKTAVYIVGANARVRRTLAANEVDEELVHFAEDELSARARING